MRNERGFTLLELLMVIIIIAVLAAMALPQYIKATEKSRAAEALQLLGTMRASQHRYRAESNTNVFATAVGDIDFNVPATTNHWGAGGGVAFNATSAQYARNGGSYAAQRVGIFWDNGTVCGNFVPVLPAAIGC